MLAQILPGTDVPGYRLYRPCATAIVRVCKSSLEPLSFATFTHGFTGCGKCLPKSFPALTCRATDCTAHARLRSLGCASLLSNHFHSRLLRTASQVAENVCPNPSR